MAITYNQNIKNSIRGKILTHAVNCLTVNRDHVSCVPRTYVRDVINYFQQLDHEERAYQEISKICPEYISTWENHHDSLVGYKRPSDLSVCYLSGPEPQNDFQKLIELGILPQNIWAFENDLQLYKQAISFYNNPSFPQPKIVKMSLEQFFKQSPKKFDIVYIDACGTVPSKQHALRCVSTLQQFLRLNSPGVLITNFSKPDISKTDIKDKYTQLIALYLIFKKNLSFNLQKKNDSIIIEGFDDLYEQIYHSFDFYYGEFISYLLTDIAAIIVPLQRFANIAPFSNIFSASMFDSEPKKTTLEDINNINNNSICRFILTMDLLQNNKLKLNHQAIISLTELSTELLGIDGKWDLLIKGVKYFSDLKNDTAIIPPQILEIKKFFNNPKNIYQFLDKPTLSLFYDVIINQLTYPLHNNVEFWNRYQYCAKNTDMFSDVIAFDECRYIYEWLPTIHQIVNAMQNQSWQYIFRFALDGLVKQRLNYNNEFFFQGSVISKNENNFRAKVRKKREIIGA